MMPENSWIVICFICSTQLCKSKYAEHFWCVRVYFSDYTKISVKYRVGQKLESSCLLNRLLFTISYAKEGDRAWYREIQQITDIYKGGKSTKGETPFYIKLPEVLPFTACLCKSIWLNSNILVQLRFSKGGYRLLRCFNQIRSHNNSGFNWN